MEFDSKEELYISWWLDELQDQGFIDMWVQSNSYSLSEKKELDGGIKLREHIYTPDFGIYWLEEGKRIFCQGDKPLLVENLNLSLLEVKGTWDAQNMTRLFKINQKWMYDKFGIYVNLVKPEELFKKTFCPNRFRLTDSGKAMRKLKAEYLTLDEYIQQYNTKDDRKGVQKPRKRQLQ